MTQKSQVVWLRYFSGPWEPASPREDQPKLVKPAYPSSDPAQKGSERQVNDLSDALEQKFFRQQNQNVSSWKQVRQSEAKGATNLLQPGPEMKGNENFLNQSSFPYP